MIDKFCEYLTNKIRKKMPDVDDERAEVIMYGIQLIVGELPKILFMFIIAAFLHIFFETLLAFILILPYKKVSGGVHLKTHIGCFIMTNLVYCGTAILSIRIDLPFNIKIALIIFNILSGIIMITKYAPADTVDMPILRKKERKIKKILSYVFLIINMITAMLVPNNTISNIFIFGTLIQTLLITRFVFILAKNKYGYEEYLKEQTQENLI